MNWDSITPEFAWFIGVYEGEGSCSVKRHDLGSRIQLRIGMTDRDVIEKIHQVAGCGNIYRQPDKRGNTDIWRWAASGDSAVALMERMLPFLGDRRLEQMHIELERRARTVKLHRKSA